MLSKNLKYGNINANASFPEEKGIPTSLTIMHLVSLFYTFKVRVLEHLADGEQHKEAPAGFTYTGLY